MAIVLRIWIVAQDARRARANCSPRFRPFVLPLVRPMGDCSELGSLAELLFDVDSTSTEGIHPTPAARNIEQFEPAYPSGMAGSMIEMPTVGIETQQSRSSSSGVAVAQACGLQAVGYSTGYRVILRG